jgi:tetratricopeptide (TPR) repeat protein
MVIVRPEQRSRTTVALIGAWGIGMAGAALALIGVGMQLAGITPQTNSRQMLLWIAGSSTALGSFATLMAWGCWGRRVFALYSGIALSLLFGLAGIGAGLYFSDQLGLIVVIVSLLSTCALLLMHLAVAREFTGERRRATFPSSTTSAIGFYQEGRAYYQSGLLFLAAQRWARALGKDPANATYLHSLGLVLAKLGYYDRALSQIERALQSEPDNQQIRESYELVRRQATSHRSPIPRGT